MNAVSLWESFKAEVKERFANFKTIHGLFLVPVSIIGIYITFTHLQYILHAVGVLLFGSAFLYGAYHLLANPIKAALSTDMLKAERESRALIKHLAREAKKRAKETGIPQAAPIADARGTKSTATSTPIFKNCRFINNPLEGILMSIKSDIADAKQAEADHHTETKAHLDAIDTAISALSTQLSTGVNAHIDPAALATIQSSLDGIRAAVDGGTSNVSPGTASEATAETISSGTI